MKPLTLYRCLLLWKMLWTDFAPHPGISGVGQPTIPAGATITAATMKVNIVSGTSTAYNAKASQVTGSWESATIQWSNMPGNGGLLEDNISHNNKTKYEFSCLAAVQHWYDGSTTGQNENYGIVLQYADSSIADYNSFYSADCTDATLRPSMTISYQSNFISAFTTYYDDYVGTITDTQANAIASAFTDFIWEKIQYE